VSTEPREGLEQVFSRWSHLNSTSCNTMHPAKTSTSSLPGTHAADLSPRRLTTIATAVAGLFAKRWYPTLARIRGMCSGGASLKTPTVRSSLIAPGGLPGRLPQEIVEIIIAYLAYHTRSLRACTLTCHSWYIAALPHLHRTLFIGVNRWDRKSRWPNPVQHMHTLGLLPLVKLCWIRGGGHGDVCFSPKLFKSHTLHQFSVLTNVQELGIDCLDVSSFMPRIQRYFGHFLPTVRSLVLGGPKGSHREIIYFIGLFQHLEDLSLSYDGGGSVGFQDEPTDDLTLIPPFSPPLRGWLSVSNFSGAGLLKDMIDLFGGIRFRYMRLLNVDGMRLLLDGCAETLEVLRLYLKDPHGNGFPRSISNLWLKASQLNSPFETLTYRKTSRFGHSRSMQRLSIAH